LDEVEERKLDRLLVLERGLWAPLVDLESPETPTPQAQALASPADELFYGGAAGGGKTDLLIGTALTRHHRSILFRREFKQLAAIEERTTAILGSRSGYNGQTHIWRIPDLPAMPKSRLLRFGACQHVGDEQAYQGQPHDLIGFDEITHFQESQFRFLKGWNRTSEQGVRCRAIAAGNPPTDSDGDWVIRYWGPWLDPDHPRPARTGELRWYAVIDGKDIEVESGAPFKWGNETIQPRSRTFIPSNIEDNPFLMSTGYKATLQALPEPLRSQMLKGSFEAGREDDPWQVIPTGWVKAAQDRWKNRARPKTPMTTLGVDPARGGRDETVLIARHDDWFAEPVARPGAETPDGPAVAALAVATMRDAACVIVDVIGVGSSVYDHLQGNGVPCMAFNSSEKSEGRDRSGSLGFFNKRAEWWWRMREALDPAYGEALCLPPDPRLRADLCAPRWRLGPRGIQVESKEDIAARIGRSTDRGDAAIYALCDEAVRDIAFGGPGFAVETDYNPHRY
jgi:hypothetical protein